MTDSDPADALSARIQRSIGEDTPVGLLTIVQATNVDAAGRLADMMRPVAAASRGEPGNLLSTIGRGDDGLTFDLHDRWRSLAAVQEHQRSDHFRATIEQFGRLTHEADIRVLSIVDDLPEKS